MGQQTMAENFSSAKNFFSDERNDRPLFCEILGCTGPLRNKLIFYSLRNSFLFKKLDFSLNI